MVARRDQETRSTRERKQDWKPADTLPVPDPIDGVTYRWIRASSYGVPDNKNISKRMREGWVPVNAKDHPELMITNDQDSRFQDGIEIGGLVLCSNSNEQVKARSNFYQRLAQSQVSSVDNNLMRESDNRMPLAAPQRRTRTTIGNGQFGNGLPPLEPTEE